MQSVTTYDEPAFDDHGRLLVTGYDLRYTLTAILAAERRVSTVAELTAGLNRKRLATRGRSSKSISDALRREVGKGRVARTGRGRYRIGSVPRVTLWRIRQHVVQLGRLACFSPPGHGFPAASPTAPAREQRPAA